MVAGDFPAPAFQFHKGTIKTVPAQIVKPSTPKFQFHKGTIKTVMLWVLMMQY